MGPRPAASARRAAAILRTITSRRRCASGSASSFFSVWLSICRIRSRVTLNAWPISSSVRGCSPRQAVAHLDHLALALGQHGEGVADLLVAQRQGGGLEGRLGAAILDEVAERRIVLVADRPLERDRLLGQAQDFADVGGGAAEQGGDLG